MAADPRFAANTARVANRPALEAEMGAVLGRLPREDAASTDAAASSFAAPDSTAIALQVYFVIFLYNFGAFDAYDKPA